ncbi:hypothetical protein D0B54_07820 [Solimonas sp. K1W22B-7]|uniref:hypothetical protein n=1 Tax=Solimonas sp. K1W22B-7 TaxID=2303331 RepID=UPI000E32DE0E|nr:hypothetical protein [Solimonas sp. K1W22B-7]AXQ28593.1 hypothetical protein D0B54_07820 [Solimonas sp. K1W22B-7]
MKILKHATVACAAVLSLMLSACSNNDNDRGEEVPTTAAGGIAAVGAPLSGSAVRLICVGGVTRNTTTGDNGAWSVRVPSSALPCAVRVNGGRLPGGTTNAGTLYSIAAGNGDTVVSNVTPLTDLALSRAVRTVDGRGMDPWYAAGSPAVADVANAVPASQSELLTQLRDAGYPVPEGFDPFTQVFQPVAGNGYDDLLEAVQDAIEAAGLEDYAALRDSYVGGGALPEPEPETPTSGFVAGAKPPVGGTGLFTSKDAACTLTVTATSMALAVAGKTIEMPLPDPVGYTATTIETVSGPVKRFRSASSSPSRDMTLYLNAGDAPVLAFVSEITDSRPTPLAGANYTIYCAIAGYPEGKLEETGPNAAFVAGPLAGSYNAPDAQGRDCSFAVATDGGITIDYATSTAVGTQRQFAYTDIFNSNGSSSTPSWSYGDPASDGLKAALSRSKASDNADITQLVLQQRQAGSTSTIAICSTENAPGRKFAAIGPAVGTYKGTQALDVTNTDAQYACTFTIAADGVMTYTDSKDSFSVSLDGPDKSYNTISTANNNFYLAGSGTGTLAITGSSGNLKTAYTSSNRTAHVDFDGGSVKTERNCRGLVKQP